MSETTSENSIRTFKKSLT